MKKSFKNSVKENLDNVSLDEQQLAQLMAMQERYVYQPAPRKKRHKYRMWLPWYKIAGIGVLSIFGVVVLLTMTGILNFDRPYNAWLHSVNDGEQLQQSSLIQRIADEVASNHLKMKPLEIEATELATVQHYFSQLTFSPHQTKSFTDNNQIALAGGRYCSIQGAKAAQLRYQDTTTGAYITLFEAAYSAELFNELPHIDRGEAPVVTYTKGIKVSMWVEKGIVMVSTEKFR